MAPVKRGWLGTGLDQLFGWMNKLPPEAGSYTIEKIRIPIKDDVNIAADLYQPVSLKPVGTLLVRSPYGIGIPIALSNARIFAARGYQVLLSSCRGTFDSGGSFELGSNEAEDGQAIVTWMRKQAWYSGAFATLGPSYLGYVQWTLLSNPPADMKTAVINTGPHDFSKFIWGTGALNSTVVSWADFMARQEREGLVSLMLYLRSQQSRLRPVLDSVPLLTAVDKHFGDTPAWFRQMILNSDRTDPFWKAVQHGDALERANIPIMLVSGWHDVLLHDVMEQYTRLSERGCKVGLTIGPWTHLGAGGRNTMIQTFDWLEEHLAGRKEDSQRPAVRVFITGLQQWRDLSKWPPATLPHELVLSPGKKLSQDLPPPDAPDSVFKYDPADPTPTMGVPGLFDGEVGRSTEDTALAARPDVLAFTTETLDRDVEVCGKPSIELYHSSNHPYVDVLAVLSEVDSKGISRSISESYVRLDVTHGQEQLKLVLRDCAHRFCKGTRIRLLIAGGSHPRYLHNLGTGESPATGSTTQPTWHTIRHNASAVSKLILPVTELAS